MREFSPFKLDLVNQCVWRSTESGQDERIPLTPKAFGVLRYLVEHPGRLVTQDELLGALWSRSYVQPEVLKHHVMEVRKALADCPKNPLFIETLPRRGYRFIVPVKSGVVSDRTSAAQPAHGRLVGREKVLAALHACLGKASRGQRQIVFVTGEPGIGKTALVDEFQGQAAAIIPGLRIALGQCIERYGLKEPYSPMLQALGQLSRGPEGEEVVKILAAQAPTWLVQFPALLTREYRQLLQREIMGTTRERMLREIGQALETVTTEHPLLLVFEDLQWVDHPTIDLLSVLARDRAPAKLMLVATSRVAELLLANHPFSALKQDLLVHRLCQEIALEPLSKSDVEKYLAVRSLDNDETGGLAELIYRNTEGNPLFIVAALDHLTRQDLISLEEGSWRLKVPLEEIDLGIPETLRQMIEAQIERLSIEEQQVLEVASVAGVSFSASVKAAAADIDVGEFENICERLSRRQKIVRAAGSSQFPNGSVSTQYEFVHALYREVLYRRQTPRRRAMLHRRIGDQLEALYKQQLSEVALELAHHFEEGLDWSRAIKYLRLAAETTGQHYPNVDTAALLEHALSLTSKLPKAEHSTSEF
jgi:predicted ATPase